MADSERIQGLIEVEQAEVVLLLEAGSLYLEMEKVREAEEIFAGVAALLPHSDVPLICLGNLHFSRGRFERALKFHREALAREASSALAQAHIGEALLQLKRKDEAKAALKRASEMDPDGDAGRFAEAILDGLAAGVV